jgi:hypothetical protein
MLLHRHAAADPAIAVQLCASLLVLAFADYASESGAIDPVSTDDSIWQMT